MMKVIIYSIKIITFQETIALTQYISCIFVLVINFIQFESSNIYAMRLRILCLNKSEPEVLILSSMAVNIYNRHITNKQYFEECDYEFMRDVYYASLIYFKKKPEVLNHVSIIHK